MIPQQWRTIHAACLSRSMQFDPKIMGFIQCLIFPRILVDIRNDQISKLVRDCDRGDCIKNVTYIKNKLENNPR